MDLKPCCDQTVLGSDPKNPREGTFAEIVKCGCGALLRVTFDCHLVFNEDNPWACGAINVEEVK